MSNTFPTLKIVQKDYSRKDGTRDTNVRLTINRKVKYFPLNVFVKPKCFRHGQVLRSDPDSMDKNILIDHYFIKAKKILQNYRIEDKALTFNKFSQSFYNDSYGSDSFYAFYQNQIEFLKGTPTSPNTIKCYVSQLNKLKEFKSEITFNEIDLDFITAYEGFLSKIKNNNINTITKSVKFIKGMLGRALDQGLIKESPLKGHRSRQINGNREFLTQIELFKLDELYYSNKLKPNITNVLKYFLFCCYTGLRYQDVKNFRHRDIKDDKYILIQMTKTKEFVRIPLIKKAKELITKENFKNQTVFNVLTDQATNRHLKVIMKTVKINKKISFHCSRHTFATNSISLGLPIDVISKILGHTDMKTTEIYTKYETGFLEKEMDKWN